MTFQIQNFVEPSRVRMIWQSSDPKERTKFHVGDLVRAGASVALFYRRNSLDWVQAQAAGFRGYVAFDSNISVHHVNVMETLSKRMPPRNRSDFYPYLEKHGLSRRPDITQFALLGYTGGRLPGDGFSFEIDFSIENMPFDFFFEVSGFRYYSGMQMDMEKLLNQPVSMVPEPDNPHDPHAVQLFVGDEKIGYVPRSHAPWIIGWSQVARLHAWIARIEGSPAKPLVSIFINVMRSTQQSFGHVLRR